MSNPLVYLAGGRDTEWRDGLTNRWAKSGKAEAFDPFVHSRQNAMYEFTEDDLGAIRRSAAVFGYCTYPKYTGMALEFGFAHALGIPIIYVPALPRVDSMMAAVSTAVFLDFDEAVDFLEQRIL
jgi:hypothetical protein